MRRKLYLQTHALIHSQNQHAATERTKVITKKLIQKSTKKFERTKHYSDEATINFIANTYNDNAASYGHYYNFSPIDKIVALYDEKVVLLERLLQAEKEKNEMLRNK